MQAFIDTVNSGNFAGLEELLADDVTFYSPVAFKPYEGKPIVAAILRGVGRVFTDFEYTGTISEGNRHALIFSTRVGDAQIEGCDFLTLDKAGKISEFTVMVRPLRGAKALAESMAAQFDQIQAEATAALQ